LDEVRHQRHCLRERREVAAAAEHLGRDERGIGLLDGAEALASEPRALLLERARERQRRAGEPDLAAAELEHPAAPLQLVVHAAFERAAVAPRVSLERLALELAVLR